MGRLVVTVVSTLAIALTAGCSAVGGKPVAPPSAVQAVSPTDAAASATKRSVQDKLDTDATLSPLHLTVVDVVLVNKTGNEYKGVATIKTSRGTTHDVALDVTADGDNLVWETDPGAFLFALQEGPPSAPAPVAVPPPTGPQTLQPSRGGMVYIVTKSGKTYCQISDSEVDCQAPFTNTPLVNGYPANGVIFHSNGSLEWMSGDLGDIPVVSISYATYRALSWTVDATFSGTRFTHTGTGRSIFVSIDSVKIN